MTHPKRQSHLFAKQPSADSPTNLNSEATATTSQFEEEVAAALSKRFGHLSIFFMVMLVMAGAIVWTGVSIALQVQHYHQDYRTLQDMKQVHRKLLIEHQRLLIEQQTFSAIPQVANRAVAELGMYSPRMQDKLILQPSSLTVPEGSEGEAP